MAPPTAPPSAAQDPLPAPDPGGVSGRSPSATATGPGHLVAGWVRLGLVALAVPQLFTGLWAVLRTEHWYERFPGLDPRLVAADPPFNAHLATDAGAGFLATGVVLIGAALWHHRQVVLVALAGYVAFAGPHLAYHAANPAPGLSDAANAVNVVTLAAGAALPLVLGWGVLRRPGQGADRTAG